MLFGLIHDVPCETKTLARCTVDRLGRLFCESCDPALERGQVVIYESEEEAGTCGKCDQCDRPLWESRVQLPATASVEYFGCRIF